MFKCLGNHVDEQLSFNEHCKRMLQKVQKNSSILNYVTRARNLISQAFIHPYLQMIHVAWAILSISSIEKVDSYLVSFTIGEMQPMTKYDGYQTARQLNQKHSASFVDFLIKLRRSHLSFSKITF